MKETLLECVRSAGDILRRHFGHVRDIRRKENLSSIVTEADLAAEAHILQLIRRRYPEHNLVAEESGFENRGHGYTWVIDPLDGTSNFAAGLPWYGVMVAVLEQAEPILGAMYLPHDDLLYFAGVGQGAQRNDRPVRVSAETELGNVLCAYGADVCADAEEGKRQVAFYGRLLGSARNVRCTNSLVDFACTIDGRLGGCVNHATRIWDIAAIALVLREAGGRLTNLRGEDITLQLDAACCGRNYAVIGANPALVSQLVALAAAPPVGPV